MDKQRGCGGHHNLLQPLILEICWPRSYIMETDCLQDRNLVDINSLRHDAVVILIAAIPEIGTL